MEMQLKNSFFCFLMIFFFEVSVVYATEKNTFVSVAPPAVDTSALKFKAAKELILQEGLEKKIQESISEIEASLRLNLERTDAKYSAHVFLTAQTQFNKKILFIQKQVSDNLAQLLAKNFSLPELNYLVALSQNSLNQKFRQFSKSSQFKAVFELPGEEAYSLLKEANKKAGSVSNR